MPKPGVTYSSGEKRWIAYYYVPIAGKKGKYKRHTESFSEAKYGSEAKDKAEEAADKFGKQLENWGAAGAEDVEARRDANSARAILQGRLSLSDAAHAVRLALDLAIPPSDIPAALKYYSENRPQDIADKKINEAIELFIEEVSNYVAQNTQNYYEGDLWQLEEAFPNRTLGSLTRDELMTYIRGRGAPATQRSHFAAIHALINYGLQQQPPWLTVNNIRGQKSKLPKVKSRILVLSAIEGAEFLKSAELVGRHVGAIAVMYFTGMRHPALHGIRWQNIDRENKRIIIPDEHDKDDQQRILEAMPKQLWVWMERYYGEADSRVAPPSSTWQSLLRKVRGNAADRGHPLRWGTSTLRKSFASHSYWDCGLKETLDTLCHTESPRTLKTHYKGNSNPKEAKAYFEVMPK